MSGEDAIIQLIQYWFEASSLLLYRQIKFYSIFLFNPFRRRRG